MSDTIILPSLTNEMILSVFKYLVDAELRKKAPGAIDFRFGCQEGIIAAVVLMFGEADDETAQLAYDKNETWLHVTERIVDEKLRVWSDVIDQLNVDRNADIDYEAMIEAVNEAVNNFALENPTLLIDALKRNL